MSRSAKKAPVIGHSKSESDKPWKIDEHRRERRTVRQVLSATGDDADRRLHREDWGNPAKAPKDGKHYSPAARNMRK